MILKYTDIIAINHSFEKMLLQIEICWIFVIDEESNFKDIFAKMSEFLEKITTSISFKILKAFVELFHDILDKTATIVKKDR